MFKDVVSQQIATKKSLKHYSSSNLYTFSACSSPVSKYNFGIPSNCSWFLLEIFTVYLIDFYFI